jgi:hypothetical protein
MEKEKYNLMYDTWMLAKPDTVEKDNWHSLWLVVKKGTYIDKPKLTREEEAEKYWGIKKRLEAVDLSKDPPW